MTEILNQLRSDLLAVLQQYQQLFKDYPMPDIRCRDVNKITCIINDQSHKSYQDCISTVESYIAHIKTIGWPFYNKSRLRNNIQSVLEDYQHPDIQALIKSIKLHQAYGLKQYQSRSILSQWSENLAKKVELINTLQNTFIKIRDEKAKALKVKSHIYEHLHYLVKHPAHEWW